jgi:RNA polymerase sigma-70 factor (ECF subfamily)
MATQSILVGLIGTLAVKRPLSMDLEKLLALAHELDNDALAELHDQFFPVVYRYVHFRLDDEQLVEDISSEVFLRLLDTLHARRDTVRDLRSWLLGTASNLIFDHLRQKYRRPTENLEQHENLVDERRPELIVERAMSHQVVREVFQELTEEQQHVLSLRFSQGLSIGETAQIVKKSVNAVKVLQYRALATLRRLLEVRKHL